MYGKIWKNNFKTKDVDRRESKIILEEQIVFIEDILTKITIEIIIIKEMLLAVNQDERRREYENIWIVIKGSQTFSIIDLTQVTIDTRFKT